MTTDGFKQLSSVEFKIPMWTGDANDMNKVLGLCKELEEEAQRAEMGKLLEEKAKASQDEPNESTWPYSREAMQLARLESALALKMSFRTRGWDTRYSGDPGQLLSKLDSESRGVIRANLHLGDEYESRHTLVIEFTRERGCAVRATAPGQSWLAVVKGRLQPLLAEGRPWYWWLRGRWAGFIYALPGALLSSTLIVLDRIPPSFWLQLLIGVGLTALTWLIMERVIPAFEMYPNGGRAASAKTLGALFGFFGWLLSSIVIPVVLSALDLI